MHFQFLRNIRVFIYGSWFNVSKIAYDEELTHLAAIHL